MQIQKSFLYSNDFSRWNFIAYSAFATFSLFFNASKYCGSVLKNNFVVLVVFVADELLSNFQGILSFQKSCQNLSKMGICCGR